MSTRMHDRNELMLQAIAWFQLMPHATLEQRTAFTDWIRTSPIHISCFLQVSAVGYSMLNRSAAAPNAPVHSWKRVVQAGIALIAACVAALAIGLGISHYLKSASWVEYTAAANISQAVQLGNGTKLVVEAGSRVRVQTLPWALTVRLENGRARFDVVKAWRTFRVLAGDTVFEDVGTSFYVARRADGSAFVSVFAGAVDVRTAKDAPVFTRVLAGHWALIPPHQPPQMSGSANPDYARGPPERRVQRYTRAPLGDIVDEINRYSGIYQLVVEDDVARGVRISGNFNVADPRMFIWALQQQGGLEVVVDRYLVVIRSRDQPKRSVVP